LFSQIRVIDTLGKNRLLTNSVLTPFTTLHQKIEMIRIGTYRHFISNRQNFIGYMSTSIQSSILNKVPEVTIFFWIIKVLGTTIGETAADFLNVNLNFGLTGTSIITGVLLIIALIFQFRSKKYTPWIYWTSIVLISVFGTLVTDNLTDALGVPLEISTIVFSVLLGLTFLIWYLKEKTLSIHSIFTRRREAFYWLTILFTFALGTASGDLMAEGLGLGYLITGVIVAVTIAVIALAWKKGLNPILSFWLIYIFTRPLGASIGDLLSQSSIHGGLGLGATVTSFIFLGAIILLVIYLTLSKKDITTEAVVKKNETEESGEKGGLVQTITVLVIILGLAGIGYAIRHASLQKSNAVSVSVATAMSPLGDLSSLRTIVQDTLNFVNQGNLSAANTRVNDLEYAWDNSEAQLKPINKVAWTTIDGKIDAVLRALRSTHPDEALCKTTLGVLLSALK
jgi:uncharacterized membrane-anchored protein